MCTCLAWHHPLWRVVGKRAAGAAPLLVYGVVTALREDPLLAGLPLKDKIAVLAEGSGTKPLRIALIVAALQHSGIVDEAGLVVEPDGDADENTEAMLTKLAAIFVRSGRGRPPLGPRAMTGAERQRRHYRSKRASLAGVSAAASRPLDADENADENEFRQPASFSLFPDLPIEEQKQTNRARETAADDFAALKAIWPVSNRMSEAEAEYRQVRRSVGAAEILALAERYLAEKPDWRSPLFLVNWLRTRPWDDPALPLASAPRAVAATAGEERPARPDWVARLRELKRTGTWRPEWGPRWGEAGCLVPPEATGVRHGFAAWFGGNLREAG